MNHRRKTPLAACGFALVTLALAALAPAPANPTPASSPAPWRDDPVWHDGRAEWALYDAARLVEGARRAYEATIFTDKELIDPATTVKAADGVSAGAGGAAGPFEVFKHNVSELIPTDNYTYRFLTTMYVRSDNLQPYKLTMSSQEDCGATYKQFVIDGSSVKWRSSCYLPGAGDKQADERRPGQPEHYQFHDALSLALRDYPFDSAEKPVLHLKLVPDQTDPHETSYQPEEVQVKYVARDTLTIPFGTLLADHLRVELTGNKGQATDFWFAADPALRRVMVKYSGPFGVRYELKKLARWAYWKDPRPQ